ncbi:hypothetical protein KGF56_003150, partial [Candida oxycetoniae]
SIVPQGARIYTEKFSCSGESYVRYLVNDAVIPIQTCATGPGFSCKLDEFEEYVDDNIGWEDFNEYCGIEPSVPQSLTFYWDYMNTTYNAPLGDF